MRVTLAVIVAVGGSAWGGAESLVAADPPLRVKAEKMAPPPELTAAVRAVLAEQAIHVHDDKGQLVCTIWPVQSLTLKDGVKASGGVKYTHLEESTVLGAIHFPNDWRDYRKQKIKAGVYVLRLGLQPMDGDHMGTAPFNEFALLCPAKEDTKPDLIDVEALHELSAKSTTRKHPGMMLLFPIKEPPESPTVEVKPKEHIVVNYQVPATIGNIKTAMGFSVVVVGATAAE